MNILLLNACLGPLPGHTVRMLHTHTGGILSLRKILERRGLGDFTPDLLLQQESLGQRVFFQDLADFSCPKVFWAIDSHLNMHWHRWYGRLFDAVATPHVSLFRALPQAWQLPNVVRLPIPGCDRPWKPHNERSRLASFVGVLDHHRTQRSRFAAFLREYHAIETERLSYNDMLARYTDSRLLPNESICREFNFRIMEGASCGCCVITEDIGEDLASNFTPGSEILTYRHAIELHELLTHLTRHPKLAETIGLAAHTRVQAEHLPKSRWKRLLALADSCQATKLSADEGWLLCRIAALQAARADKTDAHTLRDLAHSLAHRAKSLDSAPLLLALTLESGAHERVAAQLRDLVCQPTHDIPEDLAIVALGCALALRDQALIHASCALFRPKLTPKAATPFHTALACAERLVADKRLCRPGFVFNPHTSCPETALEFLLLATTLAQGHAEEHLVHRRLAELTARIPLYDLRLATAARVGLEHQDNWRDAAAYALACLESFRLKDGLAELTLARTLAAQQGEVAALRHWIRAHGLGRG